MSIATKIALTLVVLVVGTVIFGIIKEVVGYGQHLFAGAMLLIFFYIWSRPKPYNSYRQVEPRKYKKSNDKTNNKVNFLTAKGKKTTSIADITDVAGNPNPKNNFAYDQELYKKAWDEIEKRNVDVGLWAKLFVDSDGDENKTKVAYIKKRIIALQYLKNDIKTANSVIKTEQQGNMSPMHKLSTSGYDNFSERLQQIERRTSARIHNIYNPKLKNVSD